MSQPSCPDATSHPMRYPIARGCIRLSEILQTRCKPGEVCGHPYHRYVCIRHPVSTKIISHACALSCATAPPLPVIHVGPERMRPITGATIEAAHRPTVSPTPSLSLSCMFNAGETSLDGTGQISTTFKPMSIRLPVSTKQEWQLRKPLRRPH